jgi:hypothetical protein
MQNACDRSRLALRPIGARFCAPAGGAIVVLALASGMAATFGTVVDRLTAYGGAAHVSSGASPSLPPLRIADRRVDTSKVQVSVAHMVDRWFDEPDIVTTHSGGW